MRTLRVFLMSVAFLGMLFLSFSFYMYDKTVGDLPPGPPLQLSRIDFSQSVDTNMGNAIRSKVKHLKGVGHTFFNHQDDVLVFSHDPKVINANEVVDVVEETFLIPANRFQPTEEMKTSGCPITGGNTVFMQVGGFLHRLF